MPIFYAPNNMILNGLYITPTTIYFCHIFKILIYSLTYVLILIKQLVGFSVLLIHICNLSLAIHPMTKVTGVLAILNKIILFIKHFVKLHLLIYLFFQSLIFSAFFKYFCISKIGKGFP